MGFFFDWIALQLGKLNSRKRNPTPSVSFVGGVSDADTCVNNSSQSASETPPTQFLDAGKLLATTFVRSVELHDKLGSTNDRAIELARDPNVELPALVVARWQTAGRGRGRKAWWSDEGALTFSLLIDAIRMGIQPANWPQLSLATAVAACDAIGLRIAKCGVRIEEPNSKLSLGIKWPNDVWADGRKISGILIESPGGSTRAKDRVIIGIGINVNNSWHDAPGDVGQLGTSLFDLTDRTHDLQLFLIDLLHCLTSRFEQLSACDPELIRAWQTLDLIAGQTITLETDGRRIEGECVEIARDGALVLETVFGSQRFFSGTARLVDRSLT